MKILIRLMVLMVLTLPAAGAQLDGIAHVAYRVRNIEATRDFYHRLGFDEAFVLRDGDRPKEVFVKINDRQFIELYPQNEPAQPLGWMHVCYETDGAEALHTQYAGRGVDVSPVHKAGAGNLIFSFKGPAGELIEVTQYLPGSRHSEDRGRHLGAHRVSGDLEEIRVPVADLSAARQFYEDRLGLAKAPGVDRLRVASHEHLHLVPAPAAPALVLRVSSASKSARQLRRLGFAVRLHGGAVSLADPDGNVLVFQVR